MFALYLLILCSCVVTDMRREVNTECCCTLFLGMKELAHRLRKGFNVSKCSHWQSGGLIHALRTDNYSTACRDEEDEEGIGEATQVEIDGWLSLRVPTAALAPMLCLRQRLGACFAAKVRHRLCNILCLR